VALIVVVAAVLSFAFPSSEAVRLRNALLLESAPPLDASWTPDKMPPSFRAEQHPMPEPILSDARAVASRTSGRDFDVASALVGHLLTHATQGGRIDSYDVAKTYQTLMANGRGYCADIIDSFIALSHAVGIPVRPWAFSFDGLGGQGHIVVEIFDRQRNRWVMLDVFNDVLPHDEAGEPLSAMEFRDRFLVDPNRIRFVPIGPWRQEFSVYEKLVDYYVRGINQWYFWNGNNVIDRYDHWLIRAAGLVTEELAEMAAIAVDRSPHIVPVPSAENAINVARLERVRVWLLVALACAAVLSCIALCAFAALLRGRRRQRAFEVA
jgi:hypothetical protein